MSENASLRAAHTQTVREWFSKRHRTDFPTAKHMVKRHIRLLRENRLG